MRFPHRGFLPHRNTICQHPDVAPKSDIRIYRPATQQADFANRSRQKQVHPITAQNGAEQLSASPKDYSYIWPTTIDDTTNQIHKP